MHSSIRRIGWLLIAAPAAVLAMFASTVDAAVIHYPPACRAGTYPGAVNPPKACVIRSYRSDAYSTAPTETSLRVSHRLVRNHGYPYVLVTVEVGFANAMPECPEGGVPLGDIPCQMQGPGLGSVGRYARGHVRLLMSQAYSAAGAFCPESTSGVCTLQYRVYDGEFHGVDVEVLQLSVGELTENPANDLGSGGFEFPVAVHVPAPVKRR